MSNRLKAIKKAKEKNKAYNDTLSKKIILIIVSFALAITLALSIYGYLNKDNISSYYSLDHDHDGDGVNDHLATLSNAR